MAFRVMPRKNCKLLSTFVFLSTVALRMSCISGNEIIAANIAKLPGLLRK
jgi:hypothetical protein